MKKHCVELTHLPVLQYISRARCSEFRILIVQFSDSNLNFPIIQTL